MKRIAFVFMILAFGADFTEAQPTTKESDSTFFIASRFLKEKLIIEAKVFCEKNDNGIKKYNTSRHDRHDDLTGGGSSIIYYLTPGVTSMAMQFKISDTFDIKNIRYTIIEGIDSFRSFNQQFFNAKHEGKFHLVNIHGIECSQKTVMVDLYHISNPQLHTRIMIGTEAAIPKPEVAWFAYMKDSTYKSLGTGKLYNKDINEFVVFVKSKSPLMGSIVEVSKPGFLLYLEKRKTYNLLFNTNYVLIDTIGPIDSLTKEMYANGYRYKIKSWPDILSNPGTYNISIKSNTADIKEGRIEYNVGVVLSNVTFKLHYTNKEILFLLILFGVPLLIIVATVYLFFRGRNKRQRKEFQLQNELSQLKLQSIRSQLNPHFVFNALAGIQNLMNKNETEKAGNYLAAFSRITRSVLDNSAKELITVDEEVKLLTDYLQMEQLRFGFNYSMKVDEELDKHNIEIPAMLLQPFVENAVKHGIASLKENGVVNIQFGKVGNDLQLSIIDNGKGFDTERNYNGLGLQLSKSRISLLNTVYKTTPAELNIDSNAQGTKVMITLKNWL